MKKFVANMKQMLSDDRYNTISSKRVVTFICVLLMCVGFISNTFFGLPVAEHIYSSITYVVCTGLGITGIEKFSKP